MPRIKVAIANLDSRFVKIESFNGLFDMCLKFGSGVPKLVIPFNWTKHTNKFRDAPLGGNIDRRNRRGERFVCLNCGYTTNADYNASMNLEALGLAGVYSLRSLPTLFMGDSSIK